MSMDKCENMNVPDSAAIYNGQTFGELKQKQRNVMEEEEKNKVQHVIQWKLK